MKDVNNLTILKNLKKRFLNLFSDLQTSPNNIFFLATASNLSGGSCVILLIHGQTDQPADKVGTGNRDKPTSSPAGDSVNQNTSTSLMKSPTVSGWVSEHHKPS